MKLLKIEEICFSPSFAIQKCAVLAAPFQLGGASLQADATEEAADTQADAQLRANREQIAAQKSENDKAYIRNNSLGQLSQLMAAGLSEQQARQVIAGAGSTGQYEPAQIRSEMEGVDLGAAVRARGEGYANMLNTTGQTIAQTGSELVSAFTLGSGGALGAAVAAPFMSEISPYVNLIDQERVHTWLDLKNWINKLDPESEAGKVFKPMLKSKNFQRIEKFAPGMKAFGTFINDLYTSALDSNQRFKKTQNDIALSSAEQYLKDQQAWLTQRSAMKIDAETGLITQQYKTELEHTKEVQQQVLGLYYDGLMKKLGYQREVELFDVITDAQKQQYLAQAQSAINQARLQSDPKYIENWIKAQTADVQGQYFLHLLNACRNRAMYTIMAQDPQLLYVTSIYDALTQSGLNSGILGQFLQGSGFTSFELDERVENVPDSFTNAPPL